MKITFFTGPDCELCDHAQALIDTVFGDSPDAAYLSVEKKNIRTDPEYYHLYATRIPVLKREDTAQELAWPFNADSLRAFTKK